MKVRLRDVVDEIEMQSGESAAYLNKKTGELYTRGEDEILGLELDEGDDEDSSTSQSGSVRSVKKRAR